jgi:hypothetical protein
MNNFKLNGTDTPSKNQVLFSAVELALLQSNHDTNEEARLLDGNTVDFQPVVKWFDSFGMASWLITEVDPDQCLAFGLCDLGMGFPEMGSVSIDEITSIQIYGNPRIVKDKHWSATQSLTQYASDARNAGCIQEPPLDMNRVVEAVEEQMTSLYNPGFCLKCGYEQDGCEPDAEGYECENCGEHSVSGAENCLFAL